MLLGSTDFMNFDPVPHDEDAVQVQRDVDYMPAMKEQTRRMKAMLEAKFPDVPGWFTIARNEHDFGTYLSINYNFHEDKEGRESMLFVESNWPDTWDDTEVMKFESKV